jgi:hypothetical protein
MNPGNQVMNPGGQPMHAPGQPMNPVGMPAYPRGPAPNTVGSRFKRFLFNVFLVILAFAGGYLYMERESQSGRDAMERQQVASEERIAALERRIEELGREAGTRVELDLTQVFEPIREALSQVTLVKLSEISEQITNELVRVVESDLAVDLGAAGDAAQDGDAGEAELAAEESGEGTGDAAASEPATPEQAAPERAEAPAAEPTTQLPPEPGDDGELVSSGPASPEAPAAGPDVSLNAPAAVEPESQPEEAPVSDVVRLLAQYAAAPAEHEQAGASGAQPADAQAVAEAGPTPAFTAFGFDSTAELARD